MRQLDSSNHLMTCYLFFSVTRSLPLSLSTRTQKYIEALTSKTRPKKILVCMIYYPDENPNVPSWANAALGALGYNRNPAKLELLIRKVFEEATRYVVHDLGHSVCIMISFVTLK